MVERLMDSYTDATYGERVADVYDDWYETYEEASITMLAELARGGRALELGIGTGRVALQLAAHGVEVQGIDASPAMVERLRAKPGGEAIKVTIGNFAEMAVDGQFSLVYVVFNTFFALSSQEEQVRAFRHARERLAADAYFLIEAFVPDVTRFSGGQANRASKVTAHRVLLDVARHDPLEQRIVGQTVEITNEGVRLYPVQLRYAWPPELDLMARLAGLRLLHRWGGWQREPFTSQSSRHISVYERAT
jgi:SAM-dependent methyltransferase